LKLSEKGLIIINEKTGITSKKNVYAGGDITRGPSLIPEAVADGKRAAKAILESMELS
jgi:NADPH-dependent glutamate synthase beta subunit-like oxidoreductase